MNLLAIDNSSPQLSIALKSKETVFRKQFFKSDFLKTFIKELDKILKEARINPSDLDALVVGLGPGSFTGLRLSISVAKAFGLAYNKPLIGFSSFYGLAYKFKKLSSNLAIIFDARRSLIYGAVYGEIKGRVKVLVKERLIKLEDFLEKYCNKDCIFLGESVKFKETIIRYFPEAFIIEEITLPEASYFLEEAELRYKHSRFNLPENLKPLYLYRSDCQVRKIRLEKNEKR